MTVNERKEFNEPLNISQEKKIYKPLQQSLSDYF